MNARSWPWQRWWRNLPSDLRSPMWPLSLSVLTILALLLGFTSVVQSAVRQGDALRTTALTRAQAEWRCHAMNNDHQRARCLTELDQAHADTIEVAQR